MALILIDASVWVDLLGKSPRHRLSPQHLEVVATCAPVIQEVLQGIKNDEVREALKVRFTALKCLEDPLPLDLFLTASDIYATGRRKGLTLRSSTDCLIAAIALKNNATVWHSDRDFDAIAKFTVLKTVRDTTIP